MRLKKCKNCGIAFESTSKYQYLCSNCAKKSKKESVIRKRTCKQCGIEFEGGPRAWYCPECRRKRLLKYNRDYKKSSKTRRKLGSIDICQVCGKELITDTSTVTCSKKCAKELKRIWQRKADAKRTPRKR